VGVLGTPDTPIGDIVMSLDGIKWQPHARIEKYDAADVVELTRVLGHEPSAEELRALGADPRILEVSGNLLTTAGLSRITSLIIGGGGTTFSNGNAAVGVGTSSTGELVGNTALGGDGNASTARYNAADATYPSASNGVITVQATFDSGEANFAWNEWCWVIAPATITEGATLASLSSGSEVMINRKVASMGTKASGASWVFTTTVTLS
jgi:hypothetical protein